MRYLKNKRKINLKDNKILVLSIIFAILLIGYVAIPTLSQYNIASPTYAIVAWDGTVANSYGGGNGSIESPFIISNGSELAFLASQIKENNYYEGKHFVLMDDIVLNDGIFSYSKTDGIKYLKDDIESNIVPNVENDLINVFSHLDKFKGDFNGNHHTIYGLYIDESIDEQNALFTNLEGNVSNLYIKNSIIYGGKFAAGVASKTNNSILINVSYDGYVISDEFVDGVISLNINDISDAVAVSELLDNIVVSDLTYIPGIITEITLSGTYQTDNENSLLKINEEFINVGEFSLDLGTKLVTEIPLIYQSELVSNFSLSNLKIEIKYNYSNAAGIVSIAENTILKNIINKAFVYGDVYASGIINTVYGTTSLINAYNNGNIESNNLCSGLISNINQNKENVIITNSYNSGSLVSNNCSLVGNIENNTGTVSLSNVFNTQDSYGINLIDSSVVHINNFYLLSDKNIKIGNASGKFIQTNLKDLKNKEFIKNNLKYAEFTENSDDDVWVWSFDDDCLPTLYIDELNRPIANIHIKDYIWNDYKSELDTLYFSDRIVFAIDEANPLNPISEVYYYISNEKYSLSKGEINVITDWKSYEEIIEINEEGFYVIYVKIVDNNGNDIYLNTDLLVVDFTSSDVVISSSVTDDIWSEFTTNLNNYYVDREVMIEVEAEDSLSGINKIYYYVSDTILSKEAVEKLEEWNEYVEVISVVSRKSIIYIKIIDNCNNVTYANTDLIMFNGYTLNSISPGMNGESVDKLYITENSSVKLNFSYEDEILYGEGSKHKIVSNVLLPRNTKMTLIDKINSKVYVYVTDDSLYGYDECLDICEAKYDFELFNEVGSTIKFSESNYVGTINEDFDIILDFEDALIDENIENIFITLRLVNENVNEIKNTLFNSLKIFNVISENSNATFTLNSSFKDTINYSENAQYIIDFSTKLNYKTLLDNMIFDTSFEDKDIGLLIKMVDSNGNVVSKQNLKNILFMLGDKKYSPSYDGIVRINLENGIKDINDNLIIQTYSDNYNLEPGDYKFIINLYSAYDGLYSDESLSSIEIPVYVGINEYNIDNDFNVIMDTEDRIVTTNENVFDFEFLVSEKSENANIKMSLYKKNLLSPYDQKYTIVDLGDYLINNTFTKYDNNIYYALTKLGDNNILKLNLDTGLLDKNGYMFVFELYDDNRLVNKISKKFIVK